MSEFRLAKCAPLIEKALAGGGQFTLYPSGTSMLPLLHEHQDFVVLARLAREPQKYDIVLYRRKNGAFVLHRIIKKQSDGSFVMTGDNQTALERDITKNQIIGTVIEIGRKIKPMSMKSLRYKAYVFFWCRCFFFRKIILRIKRIKL